jgi:outer membrane protein insertion porin family
MRHSRSITRSPLALSTYVNEGSQYRLGGITFKGNEAISNGTALRNLFPIKERGIFSREKIAAGIDNVRGAYADLGYINSVSVPQTLTDDDKNLIFVELDIDEGKQFYVSSLDIIGLDERSQRKLLQKIPIKGGDIYNERLFNLLVKEASASSRCMFVGEKLLDEKAGTVALRIEPRWCSSY